MPIKRYSGKPLVGRLDPPFGIRWVNSALQRFTCDLYYRFGAFLGPISVGIITGKHYMKNYSPKLNGSSENRDCESAETRDYNKTGEPAES